MTIWSANDQRVKVVEDLEKKFKKEGLEWDSKWQIKCLLYPWHDSVNQRRPSYPDQMNQVLYKYLLFLTTKSLPTSS